MEINNQKSQGIIGDHQSSPSPVPFYERESKLNKNAGDNDEKQDVYARKLKRLRLSQFLGQKEMADKFKISQQSYAKMEAGKTLFTLEKVEKICRIFDISFDNFIMIDTNEKIDTQLVETYNVKVLRMHYERLLIQKDLEIKKLEIELRKERK